MKRILGLLIAFFMASEAFASIAIMPTKIELNTNKNKSNFASASIDVKGDNKQTIRFKAYTGYFKINEKGEVVQLEDKTDEHDISKKVRFVPSEFNIQPGKNQKLRVNIVGVNTLPDGENRCLLYIEDVQPQTIPLNTGNDGIGAQIIVKSRVAIPIYLDKGSYTKIGEVTEYKITNEQDGHYLNAKIVSSGNSRIRYQQHVQIFQDKKIVKEQSLLGGVVGDHNYRKIKEKLDFKGMMAGTYNVRYVLSYIDEKGKKQNLVKETQIQIKGEM